MPRTATVYPTAGLGITTFTEAEYTKIYNDLKTYTKDYTESGYTDTWYDGNGKSEGKDGVNLNDKTGCGLTSEEYKTLKNKMLKSVYENGGFYIGKYEVGTETAREEASKLDISQKPLIQENKYPYNFVTVSQTQELSKQLAIGERNSSLMFGIQWDLVLKHIEKKYEETGGKEGKVQSELKTNSTSWGNYDNATFPLTKGQYTTNPDTKDSWKPVGTSYDKPASYVLLTTGATERNSTLNIYDLAGNVWEWTLEKSTSTSNPCLGRGGSYHGSYYVASYRSYINASGSGSYNGFRPALY